MPGESPPQRLSRETISASPILLRRLLFLSLALLTWGAAVSADTASVRYVIDGDSLVLADGRQVRLIGINAPEIGLEDRPDEPLARAARNRMAQLTERQPITLSYDRETADRHGRVLAYVARTDGTDVQAQLVREGLAWCVAIPPNTARAADYCGLEREPRAAKRGIWGHPNYAPTPAGDLGPFDTGFKRVRGTVTRIGHGPHAVYLDLGPRLNLLIPREAWREFPSGSRPSLGQTLVARGWVTEYKNSLRMRVAHPAMLEILP